jgi:deoxyribose-phosphate aldolase
MNIAPFIDHTILKSSATNEQVDKLCKEALQYEFAAVCIPPIYVQRAVKKLKGSAVNVATVIGFPFGYSIVESKLVEATQAVADGATELDMVMNIAAFKNNDWSLLKKEISGLKKITKKNSLKLKVIIESGILTQQEIITCCDFYKEYEVDYLKTSTGYAEKGARIEDVQLMRHHLPSHIKIKASGGIKTYDFAMKLIYAGAERLGCSASIEIVKGEPPPLKR